MNMNEFKLCRSSRLGVWNNRHLRIFSNRIEWGAIYGSAFVEKQNEKSPIPVIRLIDFYETRGNTQGVYSVSICVKERITSLIRTIEFRCFSHKDTKDIINCLKNIKVNSVT